MRKKEDACKIFNDSMHAVVKGLVNSLVLDHPALKTHDTKDALIIEQEDRRQVDDSKVLKVKDLLEIRGQNSIFGLAKEFVATSHRTVIDYKKLYDKNAETFMKFEHEPTKTIKLVKLKANKKSDHKDDLEQEPQFKEEEVDLKPDWINRNVASNYTLSHQNALNARASGIIQGAADILSALENYSTSIAGNVEENCRLANEQQKPQTFYKTLAVIASAIVTQVAAIKLNSSINVLRLSYAFSGIAVGLGILSALTYESQASFNAKIGPKIAENTKRQEYIQATMHNNLCKTMLQTRRELELMVDELPINVVATSLHETAKRVTGDENFNEHATKFGVFDVSQYKANKGEGLDRQ